MAETTSDLNILSDPNEIPYFKNDQAVVLILSFITCGLYLIYWNLQASKVLNAVAEREVISPPIAVFAGCCLPLNIYFFYLIGKEALPKLNSRVGEPDNDKTVMLMVLGFLFPMVGAMIVQGDINKLYK